MDAVERIAEMEKNMDTVRAALEAAEAAREPVERLRTYYESGQWLRDYELDEEGKLPSGLKRGVLSEDGLHDLLCKWKRIMK